MKVPNPYPFVCENCGKPGEATGRNRTRQKYHPDCARAINAVKNAARYRERYENEPGFRDAAIERSRRYYQENQEWCRERNAAYSQAYERDSRKEAARHAAGRALGRGELVSTDNCEHCGAALEEFHMHHYLGYDPEHWLDVQFVHPRCHREIHLDWSEP